MKKGLSLLLIALALLGLLGYWSWNLIRDLAPADISQVNVSADLSLEGVELSHGKNGTLVWTLRAERAEYEEQAGTIELLRPVVTYFREEGEPVVVRAPRGQLNRDQESAFLDPEVDVRLEDSRILAREMRYDGAREIIFLTGDVRLIRSDLTMRADQATLHLDQESMTAQGNIRAQLQPEQAFRPAGGE